MAPLSQKKCLRILYVKELGPKILNVDALNSVALWKNNKHELKAKNGIFILFLNNHSYPLMGCTCLLGVHDFSYVGISLDVITFISFSTWCFPWYLLFIRATAKTSDLQVYDIIKNSISISNVKIMNYLELVVHMKSSGCQILLFLLSLKKHSQCPCEFAKVPQGILTHSSEIVVIICSTYAMLLENQTFFTLLVPSMIHGVIHVGIETDSHFRILGDSELKSMTL